MLVRAAFSASIWRGIYVLAFIPAVPLLILHAIIVPESPKWLAKKGRIDQTMDILCRIRRNSAEIGTEIRYKCTYFHLFIF